MDSNNDDVGKQAHGVGGEQYSSWRDAKRVIARYLAGEDFDTRELSNAVSTLHRQKPEELQQLVAAMAGVSESSEEATEECQFTIEQLSQYVSLGEKAQGQMPELRRHFRSCRHCSLYEMVFAEAARERDGWLELSERARGLQEREIIEFSRNVWYWVQVRTGIRRELDRNDVEVRRQIGAFALCSGYPGARLHLGNKRQPLALSVTLGKNLATVNVTIVPVHDSIEQRDFWRLSCALDNSSVLLAVDVGIGTERASTTGMRALRRDRGASFDLDPPVGEPYWLYFQWRSPKGEREEQRVELPVRYAPAKGSQS